MAGRLKGALPGTCSALNLAKNARNKVLFSQASSAAPPFTPLLSHSPAQSPIWNTMETCETELRAHFSGKSGGGGGIHRDLTASQGASRLGSSSWLRSPATRSQESSCPIQALWRASPCSYGCSYLVLGNQEKKNGAPLLAPRLCEQGT